MPRPVFGDDFVWVLGALALAVVLAVLLGRWARQRQATTGQPFPVFLVSLVVFLNLGLTGFVLAAIAARFVFPAVSLEGKQMWLLRSRPLDLKALLWSKY